MTLAMLIKVGFEKKKKKIFNKILYWIKKVRTGFIDR